MKDATLKQASKLLLLFGDTPSEQLQAILASGLLADLRDANIANINRDEFRKMIGLKPLNLAEESASFYVQTLTYWINFWHTLGIAEPVPGFTRFEERPGYRPMLFPKSKIITAEWLFQRCQERFTCWKYTDKSLDQMVVRNDRDPGNGAYVAWFRDRVEADEELANRSANELQRRAISGITLAERLVLELDYFSRTGKHLDIRSITLCSGSRCGDGGVPCVAWARRRDGRPLVRSGRLGRPPSVPSAVCLVTRSFNPFFPLNRKR